MGVIARASSGIATCACAIVRMVLRVDERQNAGQVRIQVVADHYFEERRRQRDRHLTRIPNGLDRLRMIDDGAGDNPYRAVFVSPGSG